MMNIKKYIIGIVFILCIIKICNAGQKYNVDLDGNIRSSGTYTGDRQITTNDWLNFTSTAIIKGLDKSSNKWNFQLSTVSVTESILETYTNLAYAIYDSNTELNTFIYSDYNTVITTDIRLSTGSNFIDILDIDFDGATITDAKGHTISNTNVTYDNGKGSFTVDSLLTITKKSPNKWKFEKKNFYISFDFKDFNVELDSYRIFSSISGTYWQIIKEYDVWIKFVKTSYANGIVAGDAIVTGENQKIKIERSSNTYNIYCDNVLRESSTIDEISFDDDTDLIIGKADVDWDGIYGYMDNIIIAVEEEGIYASSGTLIYQYDSENDNNVWNEFITDDITISTATDINFQFKTSTNNINWSDWSSIYEYETNDIYDLSTLTKGQYIQAKIILISYSQVDTPILDYFYFTNNVVRYIAQEVQGTGNIEFDGHTIYSSTNIVSGKIGIGNTNPTHELDIEGGINIDSMTISTQNLITNLNADRLDSQHGSYYAIYDDVQVATSTLRTDLDSEVLRSTNRDIAIGITTATLRTDLTTEINDRIAGDNVLGYSTGVISGIVTQIQIDTTTLQINLNAEISSRTILAGHLASTQTWTGANSYDNGLTIKQHYESAGTPFKLLLTLGLNYGSSSTGGKIYSYYDSANDRGLRLYSMWDTHFATFNLSASKMGILNLDPAYTLDVTGNINVTSGIYENGVLISDTYANKIEFDFDNILTLNGEILTHNGNVFVHYK